jgi:DNA ligase-1
MTSFANPVDLTLDENFPSKRNAKDEFTSSAKRVKLKTGAMVASTSYPSAAVRRFECSGTKFWEIEIKGRTTLISYGPMGQAVGRASNVDHKDAATAEKFASKKIKEKLAKGYTEVSAKSSAGPSTLSSDDAKTGSKTGPLGDGEDRAVEGSGMNPYTVSRRGAVYSCTCPGWRFQKTNISLRSCKHIRMIQGEDAETKRTGDHGNQSTKSSSKALPFSSVMLANKYIEEKHAPSLSTGTWWMSEKLDGLRAVWDGKTFLSRTGNKFYAPKEFVEDFPSDIVLDGELFCGRGEFDAASSLVRSMGGTYKQWDGAVSYQVFDAPLLKAPFEERMQELQKILSGIKHASFVAQEPVRDAAHLATKLASVEADDGEGVMLRKGGSNYEFKRSNVLLKVKSTHDAEAKVVGHEDGKGKHTGKVGALLCELPNGKRFKVGTGLSDAERARPPAIGSTITFGYFELTKGGIPRFPTFKRIFSGH